MDKQQIIDLWRLSFNDSEEFIRLYFDRVYKEENTLVIEKNGRVVSALQMLPYTMTYFGTEISATYISGACTLPEMRGKGLMRELLQNALEEMKNRSVAVSILIPATYWLFDYYRTQGYTEAFDYSEHVYTRPKTPVYAPDITVMPPEVPSIDSLYNYFNRKMRERSCCVLHTKDDFITILRDLELSGGQMLTALDELDEPVGMIFVFPPPLTIHGGKSQVYIKEFLYDDERIAKLLLQEATLQNNVSRAKYTTPPIGSVTYPFGMARVIDRERLIQDWLATHPKSAFKEHELRNMDIHPLTGIVMGYPNREAYMSLMLD